MTSPFLADILTEAEKLHASGNLEQAARLYRQALAASPQLSRTAYNLGVILNRFQDYAGAEAAFRQSLATEPELFEARLNLAFTLQEQGQIRQAHAELRQLAQLRPDCQDARFNLACLDLLTGNLPEGWHGYELRFRTASPVTLRHEQIQRWDGSIRPGLRLLVHTEQGYGDAIQMARYLPILHEQGIKLHLEVTHPLLELFSRLPSASCRLRGTSLPDVDCQIPIMSMPGLLQTDLDSIPSVIPYLSAAPELIGYWRRRLPNRGLLRIGLAWTGRLDLPVNRKRSCPPEFLDRILSVSGAEFISLQKETPQGFDLHDARLHDFSDELADLHQTAALIANLDLVITIDTAVAHLAGSMGIPTWLMLPAVPDWRWLQERNDSPWYPSMRLFRQPDPGEWLPVVNAVADDLTDLLTLRLYYYRDGIDFNDPLAATRAIPLSEPAAASEADKADFIVFPYYLEHYTEFQGIEGMWSFIGSLPFFSDIPEKHLFFSDHDSNAPYHSDSVWFRASAPDSGADPLAFPLPYQVDIPEEYLHTASDAIRYHTCFVGYLGLLRERTPLINGVISESRLVHELDLTTSFHLHQTPDVREARRKKYLLTVSRSITVLCPRGDGNNSIRFFETLAMGRIPVLYPPTRLPFEDRIAYDRFVISIPKGREGESGKIIHNWLSHLSDDELIQRMQEARDAWKQHLSPDTMQTGIRSQLARIKLQRSTNPVSMAAHPMKTTPGAVMLHNGINSLLDGNLSAARQQLHESLRYNPRSSKAYLTLGALESACGKASDAKTLLRTAIGYDHRCYDAYLLLGRIEAGEAHYQEAVDHFYQASLIRPEASEPYLEAMPLLEQLGRQEEAAFCRMRMDAIS